MSRATAPSPALRRFTWGVAGATFLLLLAGGLVTSTGSGLAVPDWPLSFGTWMPAMTGGVRFEHGHRLIASFVGLLIVIQAVWLQRAEPRPAVRALGWAAVAGVVLQGLLGGLTVLLRLPDAISVSHAALAEIVFGLTVVIALVCSRGWLEAEEPALDPRAPALSTLAILVATAIYGQILLGAVVRHTGAGLAIPDFPLAYGQLVPPLASRPVALHFAHRVGAVLVGLMAAGTAWRCWRDHGDQPGIVRAGAALAALVAVQIALGGATVLTYKAAWVATAHLGTGALCFAASLVLALRSRHLLRLAPRAAHGPIRPLVVEGIR